MNKLLTIVRQVLKVVGAGLVGGSYVSEGTMGEALTSFEGAIGALMVFAGVCMTVYNEIKAKV